MDRPHDSISLTVARGIVFPLRSCAANASRMNGSRRAFNAGRYDSLPVVAAAPDPECCRRRTLPRDHSKLATNLGKFVHLYML